jgi:hypothetical protein
VKEFCSAKAVTELKYEIIRINLLDGNGYSGAELP